jgi:hypothetical protein
VRRRASESESSQGRVVGLGIWGGKGMHERSVSNEAGNVKIPPEPVSDALIHLILRERVLVLLRVTGCAERELVTGTVVNQRDPDEGSSRDGHCLERRREIKKRLGQGGKDSARPADVAP